MANQVEKIKANISKNIREIMQYELEVQGLDFFTVTDIEVSSDHSYAKVYVSFLANPQKNIEKLNKVKGFVRKALASRIKLRRTPEINFVLDDSYLKAKKIEDILEKEKLELKNMGKDNK
ncbi:MAG: 30S ribosome-binding factor RbfA [Firmicutes bacterium]|uniref:Ribosome-binding factor A n=1 Tax=Candidatus Onthovivens merdipullorum TaxID=2840889 RepID=A0A9D9GWI1_9BACL|nr:30S ribosome-binding factor RbfA [Candidatus Onthovivens merdipullorum]